MCLSVPGFPPLARLSFTVTNSLFSHLLRLSGLEEGPAPLAEPTQVVPFFDPDEQVLILPPARVAVRSRKESRTLVQPRLLCQSTTCCTDDSTLASNATIPEDAKQKSGGVPSSLLTKVKALGFLWLGLCNALCARPLWVVWEGGRERGREGQGKTSKTALSEHNLLYR